MSDLKTIYDAITKKRAEYNMLDDYYRGQQPTVWLTKRMREIFKPLDISFIENWCSVVIDACNERINLTGYESSNAQAEKTLAQAWERSLMALEAADVHTYALVLGEAFAIVWPDENGQAEVYYNDPRLVHAIYAGDNPRKMLAAGKVWNGDDGTIKLTIYYPDRLEYYTTTIKAESVNSAEAFQPDTSMAQNGVAANPYGMVPVFHFKFNRTGSSDLVNVISLQNGINKLLADMMVAAEYGAFRQRYVISSADTSQLKNAPNEIWSLPAGDGIGQPTTAGEFSATDLKNYLDAIDRLSLAIGVITRTPKHYFYAQGGDPSGEALIAMEAPLNKKAADRIDRFRPVWRSIALFICQIEGVTVTAEEVTPQFEATETVQPRTQAEIVKLNVESGIPLDTALTRTGWTDSEIETMNAIKDEEAGKAQTSLAAALLDAEQRMKTATIPGGPNPQPLPDTGRGGRSVE
jgi:SPP1 family phage portal protein